MKLGDVLVEVKSGIGPRWKEFPVYGATVDGLAPGKELPGKSPEKYKPVTPGTIFYNPMRILIGSVAYVHESTPSGITSPDYVVFRGKDGVVDTHYFYHWLRSPLGHDCVLSLARGAVRERMLFARLAEADVDLPPYAVQRRYSEVLLAAQKEVALIKSEIKGQLDDLASLPHRIVAASFVRAE
jgi:type I restriction enzyme S subunit